ncbi:hypothetical protein MTsPCn5_19210 [Croceitalea sp. MTPC5]|uniref:helix-turn-helix domain-containing protein n=1 Tax=Croceitalea sp. MTPC5 TaxID=3056565 RepID=UPI002B3FD377|nr:hypothetical protein MTsPCn5_19210 [Croceitalea sp. MTPC5]
MAIQKMDKENIVRRIREVAADFQITAYEFAKHTALSEVGISKILNGKVKNPNTTSLEAMMQFLHQSHQISTDWLWHEKGLMKEVTVPRQDEFMGYTESVKKKKLDELAVFVAHNEAALMENPVFKSIVERKGYELIVKKLRDTGED